jgi:hypothetical protein
MINIEKFDSKYEMMNDEEQRELNNAILSRLYAERDAIIEKENNPAPAFAIVEGVLLVVSLVAMASTLIW